MNPIENIWGIMAKEINDRVLPQNREELVQSIANTWHQIPREYVEEVVLSMSKTPSKGDRCRWRSNKILITTVSLFCLIIV
jgi:hypothetical protein